MKNKSKNKRNKRLPFWGKALIAFIVITASIPLANAIFSPKVTIEVFGNPRIMVDRNYFDYGNVKNGGVPINTSIRITNIGDKPLSFTEMPYLELIEGCCPPIPSIGTLTLKPGESTFVKVSVYMHGEMGGRHEFIMHLVTNDPLEPDKTVTLISNWV